MGILDSIGNLSTILLPALRGNLAGQVQGEQQNYARDTAAKNQAFRQQQLDLQTAYHNAQLEAKSKADAARGASSEKKLLVPYVTNLQHWVDDADKRAELERQHAVNPGAPSLQDIYDEITNATDYITNGERSGGYQPRFGRIFEKSVAGAMPPTAAPTAVPMGAPEPARQPSGMFGGGPSALPPIPTPGQMVLLPGGGPILQRGDISVPRPEAPRLNRPTTEDLTAALQGTTPAAPAAPILPLSQKTESLIARNVAGAGLAATKAEDIATTQDPRLANIKARTALAGAQTGNIGFMQGLLGRRQTEIENARKALDKYRGDTLTEARASRADRNRLMESAQQIQRDALDLRRELMKPLKDKSQAEIDLLKARANVLAGKLPEGVAILMRGLASDLSNPDIIGMMQENPAIFDTATELLATVGSGYGGTVEALRKAGTGGGGGATGAAAPSADRDYARVKEYVDAGQFDTFMGLPQLQNPGLRAKAKATYKQITGKDWKGR